MRNWLLPLLALSWVACATTDDEAVDTDTDGSDDCAYARITRGAPGALQAGFARARIPAPVGIGTAGNAPFGAPSSPTPFASIYPGTQRIHGHPEIKAVALSRGPGHEVVFMRFDAVGMFSQLRNDVVAKVSASVGRDMDHAILMGATHTHSGPGRVVNTGTDETTFFDFIADKFFPEFYDAFVQAAADTAVAALEDLQPAKAAFLTGECTDGHNDRRCEDGTYTNPALPIIAVERDGQVDLVVAAYAIHGTVFGVDDFFLSQDVHGAIEEAIEDRFDHPVEALLFNSWGADMSPGSPQGVPTQAAASIDGGFQRVRDVGWTVSESVMAALATGPTFVDDPTIHLETHRLPINRDVIGYEEGVFPYPYGGVYCEGGGDCPGTYTEGLDQVCLPFNENFPAPSQTAMTVGRVGDFALLTFPGEPGTELAERIMAAVQEAHSDAERWLFMGYTQDYLGYSIHEESWWLGGYEASGALWGPRQGEYLAERAAHLYGVWADQSCPEPQPGKLVPFPYEVGTPYAAETGLTPNTALAEPAEEVAPTDVITFTVAGHDPWLGAPLAWLETADGTVVTRINGVRATSDDYNFDVYLEPSPSYRDDEDGPRTFAWTFRIPVRQPVEGVGISLPDGSYVMKVDVPQPDDSVVTVTSAAFDVVTPDLGD